MILSLYLIHILKGGGDFYSSLGSSPSLLEDARQEVDYFIIVFDKR